MGLVSSIDISNYRGIREFEEPMPLSDFNVLIGKNNAGKTSVLEALYLLLGGSDSFTKAPSIQRINEAHQGPSLAHKYTGTAVLEAEIKENKVQTVLDNQIKDIFVNDEDEGEVISDFSKIDAGSMDTYSLYFNTVTEPLEYMDLLKADQREIVGKGIHATVAEFISSVVDDEYSEVYMKTMEIRKTPEDSFPYHLDITDLGHGIIKTIPAYMSVEYFEPGLVLWDDIESSLHPSLLRKILEWLSGTTSQTVISTHSIDVLSVLLDLDPEDVSIIQLRDKGDGEIVFEEYTIDKLERHIADAGHDPRFIPPDLEL